jgi:hypothetical protein
LQELVIKKKRANPRTACVAYLEDDLFECFVIPVSILYILKVHIPRESTENGS